MRFIIILIFTLFSFIGKSYPTDTTKYIFNFNFGKTFDITNDYIARSMFYIYKQECGGYQVIFTFPDSYYWSRKLKLEIAIVDNETGIVTYGEMDDIERGRYLIVKPGEYTMVVMLTGLLVIKQEIYIIELSQKK